jgi:hypothetical protein
VIKHLPEVIVVQMHKVHNADDDGLWWFRLPSVTEDIQIESPTGNCPFVAEHTSMSDSTEAVICGTVDETLTAITSYLEPRRGGVMS